MAIQFIFLSDSGTPISSTKWLRLWSARYTEYDENEYTYLVSQRRPFPNDYFKRIGWWKDGVTTERRWQPNVASVAYQIWNQASAELRGTSVDQANLEIFLEDWSNRSYVDTFAGKRFPKIFGLSRATTLAHFISGGRAPIFDSRARRSMIRVANRQIPYTVPGYIDVYCPLFRELASACRTTDFRAVDKALFAYDKSGLG